MTLPAGLGRLAAAVVAILGVVAFSHLRRAPDVDGPSLLRLWVDPVPEISNPRAQPAGRREMGWAEQIATPHPWYEVIRNSDGDLSYRARGHGDDSVVAEFDPARVAIVRPVPVVAGAAIRVAVDVTNRGSAPLPGGQVLILEQPTPFDPERVVGASAAAELLDARRFTSHVAGATLGPGESRTLEVSFVTGRTTQFLLIHALVGREHVPARLSVDQLLVARRGLQQHAQAGGRFPNIVPSGLPGTVRAQFDRDDRVGLFALPPTRLDWRLGANAASLRFDFAVGVMARAPALGRHVQVTVSSTCGGTSTVLLDEAFRSPAGFEEPAWHDRRVTLEPCGAERRLVVATNSGEVDPPVAVVGHPTITIDANERRPNVVLISLDTLRPDKLGCYGDGSGTSPHIDRFAEEALLFTNAYSTSSYTLPSHASMMTGQYPIDHGAEDVNDRIDPLRSPILADVLADFGYRTAAFTGGGYVSTAFGFGEGFERYSHTDPVWARGTLRGRQLLATAGWEKLAVNEALLGRYDARAVVRWLERHADSGPFFLFLHTFIVHNYAPTRNWLARQGLARRGEERAFDHRKRVRFNEGEIALGTEVFEQYMPYYEATIGSADDFVSRVLQALRDLDLHGATMVLLTSDHGEEFGEHAFFGHGRSVFDNNARVPLIVRLPGPVDTRPTGRRDELVSLVDLPAWILRVVGVPPDPRMEGAAASRLDGPAVRSTVFVDLNTHLDDVTAVRRGAMKLIVRRATEGRPVPDAGHPLYDLEADPEEARALDREYEAVRSALQEDIAGYRAAREEPSAGIPDTDLPPAVRRQLEALGYDLSD